MSKPIRYSTFALAVALVAACSDTAEPPSVAGPIAPSPLTAEDSSERQRAVAVHLLNKAQTLSPAYPQLRLVNLRYADDLTLVCGYLVAPGEQPFLFASSDTTPETIDRPIGMPNLAQAGAWRDPRDGRGQAIMARQCARGDLTPTLPDTAISETSPTSSTSVSEG